MKSLLKRREAELQKIIRQMKEDELEKSTLYKTLEQELKGLKSRLSEQQS